MILDKGEVTLSEEEEDLGIYDPCHKKEGRKEQEETDINGNEGNLPSNSKKRRNQGPKDGKELEKDTPRAQLKHMPERRSKDNDRRDQGTQELKGETRG